jgi:hypothetical protein
LSNSKVGSSLIQRLFGLIVLALFAWWLLNEGFGSTWARIITPENSFKSVQKGVPQKQLTQMGDQVFSMERNRTSSTLGQRLEHWKRVLEKNGEKARVFRDEKSKIWVWSKTGDLGVHLEEFVTGTVERVFTAQVDFVNVNKMDDFWKPPWSALEFSSSGIQSPQRQLRIYRSEGGAETLREHYLETLKEEGWTSMNHGGDVLIFQRDSSRAWIQITSEGSHSRVTLLLTL